jgi:ATP-dependent Lon protease
MRQQHRSAREVAAIAALLAQYTEQGLQDTAADRPIVSTPYARHRLFDPRGLGTMRDRLESLSKDSAAKLEDYIRLLEQHGAWRRLAIAPAPDALNPLRTRFPHFSTVIDWVAGHLALANLSPKNPLTLPPMLFAGDPGVGKTFFASELAKVLNTHYFEIGLASASSGFVIGGLDLGWSTGQSGQIFDALVSGPMGNPIIVLDEIDKTSGDAKFEVLGPLYPLLETHTAKRFKDEAVQLPIDASKIIWVATANNINHVSDPIQSRFTIMHVPTPTANEGVQIARHIYADMCQQNSWGTHFSDQLNPKVLGMVAETTPRAMRKLLTAAAGKAALAGRRVIEPCDIKVEARRQLGFI